MQIAVYTTVLVLVSNTYSTMYNAVLELEIGDIEVKKDNLLLVQSDITLIQI